MILLLPKQTRSHHHHHHAPASMLQSTFRCTLMDHDPHDVIHYGEGMRLGHGHDIAAYLIFSVVASLCIEEEHEEGNPKENGCCFYCSSCRRRNNAGTAINIGSWKLQTEERYGILHLFNHSPAPTHPHRRPHTTPTPARQHERGYANNSAR